jgi:putative ABC transport system permease protein
VGTTILNNVEDIHNWQSKTFKGDYFIRALTPNVGSGESPAMSELLQKDLRAVEGVTDVNTLCFVPATMRLPNSEPASQKVQVLVRDFAGQGALPMDVKEGGDDAQVKQKLSKGQVVLGTVLANRAHSKIGDEITLETGKGPRQLRVAATTTVYLNGGMAIYMEGKTARQLLDVEGVNMFVIHTAPEARAAVYDRLKALCDENGLMLHSFADLRRLVDSLITGVVASLWGVLALGFVVGAFGIANTLTMNVLEQTRDLALLRVVAMTRWQVRKTILAQAIIIGFIGLTLGSAGGLIGSYTSNFCSGRLLGNPIAFAFQPQLLAICFGVGMVVVLAAAWLPAERAARLNLLIALQYE